ncbi:interferon-inducible GTPase 5-like [Callorhinchus milii]|uniref:interferon-inducible GTPase 5-like n=1 Tax=Callorhinchus milii TaxID=7868 RepID=UPI001C3FD4A6|nr:interferon-inducible GTPase 5-like [Callorhinchus milii]
MASPSHSKSFNQEELKQLQAAFQTGGVEGVTPLIQKKLQDLESVELNIAVTGASGAGKSTAVNAMRGLQRNDEGAAPTGNVETTQEPTGYLHPDLKGVYFWDLPGIGTSTFKAKQYLKKIKFKRYDFFIIISHTRFTENDTLLAKEIKRLGKNFYFVRSKVDNDLNGLGEEGIDYNKEAELEKIRKDCVSNLEKAGIQFPSVFLISSLKLDQFDFLILRETLANDLPDIKKDVFILSFPNTTVEIVEQKRDILKKRIWMMAVASASVGAVPVPGLSFACDFALLVTTIIYFRHCLGLDDASLGRLARRVGKPVEDLKAVIKTPLVGEINIDLVTRSMLGIAGIAISALEIALDFIPVVGSLFGASSSFIMTYKLLSEALDDLVKNAQSVVRVAFDTN